MFILPRLSILISLGTKFQINSTSRIPAAPGATLGKREG